MKAKVTDTFGDVLYQGSIAATGARTGTHPLADRAMPRTASRRAEQSAPCLRDDLQAIKRRPWDAPMATARPPVDRVDATLGAVMAAASLALVIGGVILTMWLSD